MLLKAPFLALLASTVETVTEWLPLHPMEIKLGFCLFLAYILGMFFKKLKEAKTRYSFGLAVGLLFQLFVFGKDVIYPLVLTTVVYLLAYFFHRKSLKPILIFVGSYSSAYQVYKACNNVGIFQFDVSLAIMMGVWKFIAFAWAYRDGDKREDELSKDQNYRKIEELPSALEFYSYIYFFPTTLIGPFFDFKDYKNFITLQHPFDNIPYTKGNWLGLQSLIFGVLSGVGEEVLKKTFNVQQTLTHDFMSYSLLYRICYIIITGYVVRFRCYAGFYMSQAGVDSCGLSFTGYKDKKPVFERVLTCARYAEVTANAKQAMKKWNSSTQACLERYIFNRVLDHDRRKGRKLSPLRASIVTFFIGSTWHGFQLHCYLTFFGLITGVETAKAVYGARHKFKFIPKWISLPLRYLGTILGGNLMAAGLSAENFLDCLKLYSTIYWIPIIMNLSIITFLTVSGWRYSKKHEEKVKRGSAKRISHEKKDEKRGNQQEEEKKELVEKNRMMELLRWKDRGV